MNIELDQNIDVASYTTYQYNIFYKVNVPYITVDRIRNLRDLIWPALFFSNTFEFKWCGCLLYGVKRHITIYYMVNREILGNTQVTYFSISSLVKIFSTFAPPGLYWTAKLYTSIQGKQHCNCHGMSCCLLINEWLARKVSKTRAQNFIPLLLLKSKAKKHWTLHSENKKVNYVPDRVNVMYNMLTFI